MQGLSVVTPEEMQRVEKLAYAEGERDQSYMENAAAGMAAFLESILVSPCTSTPIYLLVGKGNNGGDALATGVLLAEKGFSVHALLLYPHEECSPLSQKMYKRLKQAGGKFQLLSEAPTFDQKGIILDGIVGTGFKGKAEGKMALAIEGANQSGLPIFAIDIPSGLNGATGEVENIAIHAHTTLSLGLPKLGFFIEKGWDHVGNLVPIDFGMPDKYLEQADPIAHLISEEKAAESLPPLKRTRHKYQAGYVLAIGGSKLMPGAALLATLATLKAGAGIVRLFYPHEMQGELSGSFYELIKEGWDLKNPTRIFEESTRAKAMIIGPGMGRSSEAHSAVKMLLSKTTLPCILDADALYFLSQDPEIRLPKQAILTPHTQEMARILGNTPTFSRCQEFVKVKQVTLVLKGAPTVIFHPHAKPLIIPYGDPGMATAGSGDVLTGILAALVAQGLDLYKAASLGVYLHSLSGETAAFEKTSYSMTATDLIHYLPDVFHSLLS